LRAADDSKGQGNVIFRESYNKIMIWAPKSFFVVWKKVGDTQYNNGFLEY
jgi:hypothetical protein